MTARARRNGTGLTCVVLAAGGSSRLGRPKQLARFRARALLRRAVDAAVSASGRPAVVVVGADALRLRAMLRRSHPHCPVVTNPRWRSGLAGSLHAGLDAAPAGTRAVLFVLSDQPFVDATSLARLVAAWRRQPGWPAAARYSGRIGVPAVLPWRTWPALRALRGDTGARAVLSSAPHVTVVDMPEAAADVDTPADLAALPAGTSNARRRRVRAVPGRGPRRPSGVPRRWRN